MIIYEVNLEVGPDILPEVEAWLPVHVKEVLDLAGFEEATIFRHSDNENAFSIRFTVTTMAELNTYLQNLAPKIRAEVEKRFPRSYKAWRRVLKEEQIIDQDII